jgi:hypothetical protein
MSALAARFLRRAKTRTNPVFFPERLRVLLHDDPDRYQRILDDPDSLDLLVWNIFGSLGNHSDREWLAHRLQAFGGSRVRAPVRLALWTGRDREPRLEPSPGYVATIRQRIEEAGGGEAEMREFTGAIDVPVRVESPDVLCLIDPVLERSRRGAGGRDRILELIDAGLEQARRIGKELAVTITYVSGTQAAREVSGRINRLRDPAHLAAELAHRGGNLPPVVLREVPWQRLIAMWEQEIPYLRLHSEPVRAFRTHLSERGLRAP